MNSPMMQGSSSCRDCTARLGPAGSAGMSLLELVVALAIVAILAVVAVPGYRTFLLRSHRVEATAALLGVAAAQEAFYLRSNTYTTSLQQAPPDGLGLQPITGNGHYAVEIVSADTGAFTAIATAAGRQASDTHCAEFAIDQAGTRTATSLDCWSR